MDIISEARTRVRRYPAAELAQLLGLDPGEELTKVTVDYSHGTDDVRVIAETRQPADASVLL